MLGCLEDWEALLAQAADSEIQENVEFLAKEAEY